MFKFRGIKKSEDKNELVVRDKKELEKKKSTEMMKRGGLSKKGFGPRKMSGGKTAWGIDIGDNELKATKVRFNDGKLNVLAAEKIAYTTPDEGTTPDKAKMIEEAVSTFVKQNSIEKSDKIIVSLSGRLVLSRFVSLPPMKKGRIPEAIKFELRKQIPFETREIVWDSYQFKDATKGKGNKGAEVGIFATKKENIYGLLPSLKPIEMNIEAIQTTPVAIYNLVLMISDIDEDVIVLNVEKGNTDFIVAGKLKFWNRSIAISEVNMDFVREIQRSMGYYVSLTKDAMPENIFLMGEMFEDDEKIKLVKENLEGKVTFLNLLDKIKISGDVDPSKINEKTISNFGTVFGLALQGLGLGKININFLPFDYVRKRLIPIRRKLISAITALIFLSLFTQGIKDYKGWRTYSKHEATINTTLKKVDSMERAYKNVANNVKVEEGKLRSLETIGAQGRFWIEAIQKIINIMPENVYLLNMQSRWGQPYTDKGKKGGKGKTDEKVLIISIKGESYDPSMSYIEDMIKKPLEELKLFDRETPAFKDIEIVKGSVRHVSLSKERAESISIDVGQNRQLITFEVRWIVDTLN